MDHLHDILRQLTTASIIGEVWVDGSFITEKIDSDDADLLIHVSSDQYDNDPSKRAMVDWAGDTARANSHSCDVYTWIEYTHNHPLFGLSEDYRNYWTDWYGHSRRGDPKGVAVVALPMVIS